MSSEKIDAYFSNRYNESGITDVSETRSYLGAVQNRLEHTTMDDAGMQEGVARMIKL